MRQSKIVDMGIEPMTFCALVCEADVIATTPIDFGMWGSKLL